MASVKLPVKFLILILGSLVVFFGILSVIVIQRETSLLTGKAAEQEHLLSRTIITDLKDNMLAGRPRSTLKLMENLRGAYSLARLDVLRKDGSPAFDRPGPRLLLPQIAQAFETGQTMDFDEEGMIPLHTNIFPLKNESECRRCHGRDEAILGVILISHRLEETIEEIRSSKRKLAVLFISMLLVTGMFLYLTVRKLVLSPLQSLHRGAEVIGRGDLNHRITIAGRDEFRDLAGTFNEMAGRLQETYGGLENMVKARTAELNENVRLMEGILSSMSSGVALLTADGRVKLINPHGAWILGRGHGDLAGKSLAEVVPETAAFLSARVGSYGEIMVRTPDERTMPVGFTTSSFPGSEGGQDGFIIVFHDLTELKALQEELLNKERFASMGRVVAGVAHEIRNPLFGISAIGQIFERDLKEPGHRELAQALLSEAKRLNQLVEELLIYGRPMKLKREDADLRILWEEVLDMHHDELQRRNIKVTGDYAVRHPVAYFDPQQVRQVFLNLLRNAIEAMPQGGAINITMLLADSDLLFQVTDTGIGMPKESLEHIFELFFTTKPKGTGLGLAICRKIMRDHGGDITIDSVEGRGTTATITLPYRGPYDDEWEGLS
jgi:signal transduction histidine kinase/HAMP domain-containing protein